MVRVNRKLSAPSMPTVVECVSAMERNTGPMYTTDVLKAEATVDASSPARSTLSDSGMDMHSSDDSWMNVLSTFSDEVALDADVVFARYDDSSDEEDERTLLELPSVRIFAPQSSRTTVGDSGAE
jgi:hypothetical protein